MSDPLISFKITEQLPTIKACVEARRYPPPPSPFQALVLRAVEELQCTNPIGAHIHSWLDKKLRDYVDEPLPTGHFYETLKALTKKGYLATREVRDVSTSKQRKDRRYFLTDDGLIALAVAGAVYAIHQQRFTNQKQPEQYADQKQREQ
ncbi:MAG: hypothetical protein ACREC6_03380 [Hyphomicrobiaceae bacterium]